MNVFAVMCLVTREVVGRFKFVGDVSALKDLKHQVFSLCLHLLLQGDLYFPHHLSLT